MRAIAPVAGIPPNTGDATFATPCAISSMFERWRFPVIPSATTAERSDSMPASRAMVIAGLASARSSPGRRLGSAGAGSANERAPKREPIVSTSSFNAHAIAEQTTSATNGLGTRDVTRGHSSMMRIASTASAIASTFTLEKWSA